jgi:hypothetical protein
MTNQDHANNTKAKTERVKRWDGMQLIELRAELASIDPRLNRNALRFYIERRFAALVLLVAPELYNV